MFFLGPFLLRLLKKRGDESLRVQMAPPGRGSAAAFVIEEFPKQAKTHRSKAASQQGIALLTMVDADDRTVDERRQELLGQLEAPRAADERIAIFVPKWEVETWVEYLLNGGPVDQTRQDYEKYKGRESACHPAADQFLSIAPPRGEVPDDCPASLRRTVTEEYRRLP